VELYQSIADLPLDARGWLLNAPYLLDICVRHEPALAVHVGCGRGLYTRFIAQHVPEHATVLAVDAWTRSREYHLFLSNVKRTGLTRKIVPVRMASLEAADALAVQARLVYLDGGAARLPDIAAWSRHVAPRGVLCGGGWGCPRVRRRVRAAARRLRRRIVAERDFWRVC
jgi:hypothetical protein